MVILEDSEGGIEWILPKHQRELWDKWVLDWSYIERLKRTLNAQLLVVVKGDLTENTHHSTVQLVSPKPTDHVRIAFEALKVPLAIADKVVVTRGTPSHAGQGAGLEELVVKLLQTENKDIPIEMSYIYEPTIEGVKCNFAHHGAFPGSRKWLEGNVMRYVTRSAMLEYITRGEAPIQLMDRSHFHRAFHETVRVKRSGGQEYVCETLLSPAYSLASEFALRAKVERELVLSDLGMYVYVIEGGKLAIGKELVVAHDVRDTEVWPLEGE